MEPGSIDKFSVARTLRDIATLLQLGIPFVLSTDAHSTRSLAYSRFSVLMARRGGLRVSARASQKAG